MKIQVKVSPTVIVELEAEKQKDLFKLMASAHEVFGETKCGLCGSTNIRPVWRKVDPFEYPEYHCQNVLDGGKRCGARLALGTNNDSTGTLFPKRPLVIEKGKEDQGRPATKAEKKKGIKGAYGSHNGWTRYKGEVEPDDAAE